MPLSNRLTFVLALLLVLSVAAPTLAAQRTVTDARGKAVAVPETVDRLICSGSGCLRLLTYLEAQDLAVAVDDMEGRRQRFDARPYALANPQFKTLPVFGQFRGHDDPERILALEPQPQVVLKTYTSAMGYDPDELAAKTGLPVLVVNYGDLGRMRGDFFQALTIMGEVTGRQKRAAAVVAFFEERIADLARRTADIPEDKRPGVFVGGIAFKGPHGFQSTEPVYPPFGFVAARNLAYDEGLAGAELRHADVAKEQLVAWDPDILFLDLSTLQMGEDAGGLHELRSDPAYRTLSAVRQGKVYGLLPYNWYTKNYGSILANAYFIGKTLYPERFADIDPAAEADAIYSFLVGKPVFAMMDEAFANLAFQPAPVD